MSTQTDISGSVAPSYFSRAIRHATDSGAQIINISMDAETGSPQLTEAVDYALSHGSLVFAAVGSGGDKDHPVGYPAATPGVVGVAAVGKNLKRTEESAFGDQVDVAAPGEDMVAACRGETGLCRGHGTSDATAIASASAALIWSAHPDWTNNQVLRVMLNTIGGPTDGAERNDSIGYGIIRPRIALKNPGAPGPADVYPLPDLAASASPAASPSSTEAASRDAKTPAAATAKNDGGNGLLWAGLGGGAVLVLGGVGAAFVVARRRRPNAF
ncbi:S8 family serine peptidase [Streptomyces nodosus]|uniref:S8 family serine peptidase n=1 Tax=Streptomyces nodosus TaxID=40318 RepID=UPI003812BBFA